MHKLKVHKLGREPALPTCTKKQRWQQVIFCKSKSSHKSFPCKSKSSHKSFPCKSKSSHKSFGQTSSQVTSHLVQTQVKSQVSLSKYKSSRTLFCPAVIRNQGQASNQSTVSYSQRYRKWSMVFNICYRCTNMEYHTCKHNEIGGGGIYLFYFLNLFDSLHRKTLEMCNEMMVKHEYITIGGSSVAITIDFFHSRHKKGNMIKSKRK